MSKAIFFWMYVVFLSLSFGCTKKETISTDIVDQNQTITRDNATMNARRYKVQVYPAADQVVMQSDSSVTNECRFGDGWASGKIYQNGNVITTIKCQTNGSGKGTEGCLTDGEFQKKEYAKEDGHCNDNLTHLDKMK